MSPEPQAANDATSTSPEPRPPSGATTEPARLVLATDEIYFSIGAEHRIVPGVDLYLHHGLTDVAAGAVAIGVAPHPDPEATIRDLGRAVAEAGAPAARVYPTRGDAEDRRRLEDALRSLGRQGSDEVVLAGPAQRVVAPRRRLVLRPVETDADWDTKLGIHRSDARGPDGHDVDPHRWVAFERAKAADPRFRPMLLVDDEVVAGTVALLEEPGLVRVKNLVLAPDHRGRGLARDTIAAVAASHPGRWLGCMALAGSPGHRAYVAAGLTETGSVREWIVPGDTR